MLLLRRFLWIIAFAFWIGGFSFYGGVVVTVGARVVAGGEAEFGFVTRQVTNWLNLSGGVALFIFLISWFLDRRVLRPNWRWGMFAVWLAMAALHIGLIVLHSAMDRLLDPESLAIHGRADFQRFHSVYLMVSSLQWAGSLVLLWGTLWTWKLKDQTPTRLDGA